MSNILHSINFPDEPTESNDGISEADLMRSVIEAVRANLGARQKWTQHYSSCARCQNDRSDRGDCKHGTDLWMEEISTFIALTTAISRLDDGKKALLEAKQ